MLIGNYLGPFEIEKELGCGAMGTVYKATFHREGKPPRTVALKIVSLALLGNESAMARFEREGQILSQLRHPNIVSLIVAGRLKKTTPPTPIIAMEYIDGKPLDRILADRGRLGWEDVVAWGKQLCAALQHAHEKGIIHRDLKPSNIMIARDGVLKLTDFGIAKDIDVTALTGANSTVGTAAYMSPEQCRGERHITPKSDLYSLGVVFYELLTGKKPLTAETTVDMFLKHVNEMPIRPRRVIPDVPVWLDNLIMFLMEKDKDHRPLDAATVGRMLEDIELKAAAQQSVAAEVANAKRKDRPIGSGKIDSGDLEAARSLRGMSTKKVKKKGTPWYRKTWFSIAGAGLVFAGMVFLVYQAVKPPPLATLLTAVENAPPGGKLPAAEELLTRYGSDPDPRVEQVRAIFRDERAAKAESVLALRFGKEMLKRNHEGFDEKGYRLAMQALDAEKAGDLGHAAELWSATRDTAPAVEPAEYANPEAVRRAVLGWVADRRLAIIRQEVPATLAQVKKQIETERIYENPRKYDPLQPESVAARALIYEQYGDRPKAKDVWDRLAAETEKEPAQRVWFLLAARQSAQIGTDKRPTQEITAEREKRIADKLADLERIAHEAGSDEEYKAARRNVRIGCRDLIALYGEEPSEPIKAAVARARQLLESTPK